MTLPISLHLLKPISCMVKTMTHICRRLYICRYIWYKSYQKIILTFQMD